MLEGLFGLYHGLKRIRLDKRQTIATYIGNVMHLSTIWLTYANHAGVIFGGDWDALMTKRPDRLPSKWHTNLPTDFGIYDLHQAHAIESDEDAPQPPSKASRSEEPSRRNSDTSETELSAIHAEAVNNYKRGTRACDLENRFKELLAILEDGDRGLVLGDIKDLKIALRD